MFMSRFIDWVHNKAERKDSHKVLGSLEVLRRLLLGITIPVLILSTTYSSVFFMKGEPLWGLVHGFIMMLSGWCVFKLSTYTAVSVVGSGEGVIKHER